jgi:acyl-CoA synthetase (AMP-forming)/AMP-acid ligase II
MSRTHLAILGEGDGPVARVGGRGIVRGEFLAEIEALAACLPERAFVVNYCTDRYRFTVGWMAAMLRGQITLLPSRRDAGAVAALLVDYPALYVLLDDDAVIAAPCFRYPELDAAGRGTVVPAFAPDQIAAVLFTSGSTGLPQASVRRWGRLVAGSLAAGSALGVARHRGAALIATVPHAHSYGLESAVMLPLQHGLVLTAERPFFPADVAAALDGDGLPGILVTTPVHLRALVGDDAGAGVAPGLRAGFVLSATAPLSADVAQRAEALCDAPVFEIYGCSEAGQLATRRTTDGPVWRCLEGFRLYQASAGCWASGPCEDDVLLGDEIEPVGDGFILRGRVADLINVGGKRSSLAYLTRQLLAIDGVRDGVFLMPDQGEEGVTVRLVAVAVAPGLDAATILGRLRSVIDPAFLPRPLHVVETLPRDALGKLPRADILRLIGLPRAMPLLLRIPADHKAGPGHFPNNPIVPGAVLLDELVHAVCQAGWSGVVEAAKFHHPVRPGDALEVSHKTKGSSIRFECHLAGTRQLVLSGVLRSPSLSQ